MPVIKKTTSSLSVVLATIALAVVAYSGNFGTAGVSLANDDPTSSEQVEQDAESKQLAEEIFVHRVLPVLKEKCFACHGDDPKEIRGELNMLSRDGLLKGGESEEASVVPGKPAESPLLLAVKWDGLEMPPKENDRLNNEQIEYIEQWIAAGAPWPNEKRIKQILKTTSNKWNVAGGVSVETSGGLADDWTNRQYDPENLWAYQPLWQDDDGIIADSDRNPVDVLVDQHLKELGLSPAPKADRRTLIRRATFDLTGLPPTPNEIADFLNDSASDQQAFVKVVDRLLASGHYGEKYAQHWLDVVRYADSSGFANDYERGSAWRYRDYVIRSFNNDKPYEQFIREQIAGDEIDESDPENLIAAGFLRMGPWELTGMEVAKVARQRFLDDVTDSVGQVFLGHMLQCARCHDHKFDPVPTRDYYSIQAAFATTQLADRTAEFLPEENLQGFDETKYLQQRKAFYAETLKTVNAKITIAAARQWYRDQGYDSAEFEQVLADLKTKSPTKNISVGEVRRELAKRKVDPKTIPPKSIGFAPQDFGLERIARKGQARIRWVMDRYQPVALSVYAGKTPTLKSVYSPLRMPKNPLKVGELEQTAILTGGDPFSPSQKVSPSILSVVKLVDNPFVDDQASKKKSKLNQPPIVGRREKLADWIASKKNPLTARVMVNRIWQWHFGQAIAGNPNNFGTTGKKPTHPELLDFLAGKFMDADWSIKKLHRIIMLSEAYQRSSQHPSPKMIAEKDPNGISYAVFKPRRLTAEEMRDAMLAVSGELNTMLGGIPARPEMNLEAALQPRQVMGTFAEAWQPNPLPEQRHRRSIYVLKIRGLRDPFMDVFNAPSPDLSCEAREASTVTPQVFSLFNSEITFDRALALANRLKEEARKNEKKEPAWNQSPKVVQRAFQLAYGRPAEDAELAACLDHWQAMTARHRQLKFDPPEYPTEVVREAVEENTGEKFTFVEPLEVYEDFVPDLKPADASPELRGLAELCLVLLNSNEFAYVY